MSIPQEPSAKPPSHSGLAHGWLSPATLLGRAGASLFGFCIATPFAAPAQVQDLYKITDGTSAAHVEYHPVNLAPGGELPLADLPGPGKITYFYYTDDGHEHPGEANGEMYQGLVLKIYWDGARDPSVEAPLWDFFGALQRRTIDYQSAPMQINHFCYMCYLPMPFSRKARLVLANDGDQYYARSVAWGVDYERNAAMAAETSRLHAAWRRSNPTQQSVHTLLDVHGRGQYVGNFLQVNSNYQGWWGEGDTIFHVDGEKITHTPGTEDEYGSAWAFEHLYSYLYSGYLEMQQGKNRMYRWYLANPVRFQKSLRVEIQDQRFENGQIPSTDDFTSMAFWYQEGASPAPAVMRYLDRIVGSKGDAYGSSNKVPAAGADSALGSP